MPDHRPPAGADSVHLPLYYSVLGGGAKPPLQMFLNVARRVHGGKGPIRRLTVTDGYLFASQTEHGKPSPTESQFLDYLGILTLGHELQVFCHTTRV